MHHFTVRSTNLYFCCALLLDMVVHRCKYLAKNICSFFASDDSIEYNLITLWIRKVFSFDEDYGSERYEVCNLKYKY